MAEEKTGFVVNADAHCSLCRYFRVAKITAFTRIFADAVAADILRSGKKLPRYRLGRTLGFPGG